MLEITRLNEITYDDFKKAINNVIANKIFVRNGIQKDNIPKLDVDEQLGAINVLVFNNNLTHMIIKTIHNIEWTPIQLYDTAYYMVNMNTKFWLISHNLREGFVVKYYLSIKDYLTFLFHYIKNRNIETLSNTYWPTNFELYYSLNHLLQVKETFILIKQNIFNNSSKKISHYIYKYHDKIYYFPISDHCVYKPILYSTIHV